MKQKSLKMNEKGHKTKTKKKCFFFSRIEQKKPLRIFLRGPCAFN